MSTYTCLRCGVTWTPKKLIPKKCPNCNSPYWSKPRRNERTIQSVQFLTTLPMYHCLRCLYNWTPQVENPIQCPACKTSLWNTPRVKQLPPEQMARTIAERFPSERNYLGV